MKNITARVQIQFDQHGNQNPVDYTVETLTKINEILQREMGDISPIIFTTAIDRSDIDVDDGEESHVCPECGTEMDFAMNPDDVGNGLHEDYECPNCGHEE